MHIGNNNHYTKYTMNGSKFSNVSQKKKGVTIKKYLHSSKHYSDVKTIIKLVCFIGKKF